MSHFRSQKNSSMSTIKRFTGALDFISRLQMIMIYPIVILVFITCLDVVARSVFNSPIIWEYDVDTQLFAGLITLCWAYTLHTGAHVRIAVLPDKLLSPRGQEIVMIINFLHYFVFLKNRESQVTIA